ncbi:MAG: adenylate kinase [Candidatus Bathyarchaeota archaeon]|nr:adenylate kinase [Candidatus Bathyarchaeota archaeon]
MRNRVIIVTGIPGVGKTTVLKELVKKAGKKGVKLNVINYASIMLKVANEKGKNIGRDDLRRMPIDLQRALQMEAAEKIEKMISEAPETIIDTHMTIRTNNGYWSGIPLNVLKKLHPNLFVLLEAEPSEIVDRRLKDKARKRDKALIENVKEEMGFSRFLAASCATLTGAPVKILKNLAGKQVDVANQLLDAIQKLGGA